MQTPARCANNAEEPVPIQIEIFGLKAPCEGTYMIIATLVSVILAIVILAPTSEGVKYFFLPRMKNFWDRDVPQETGETK